MKKVVFVAVTLAAVLFVTGQILFSQPLQDPFSTARQPSQDKALPGVLMLLLEEPDPGKAWTDPVTGMEFVWVSGGCFDRGCGDWDGECFSST